MADKKKDKQDKSKKVDKAKAASKRSVRQIVSSTTSLGKRRSLRAKKQQQQSQSQSQQERSQSPSLSPSQSPSATSSVTSSSSSSRMSNSEYGSQASPMRRQPVLSSKTDEIVKVAILGAAGGIGQPLALLLMLHNEYIQHLALYDLVHVHGVGADLSHIDRQCKVSTHMGPDELPEAVRGAKVIVIPAGLAQKPGMSRDDLFGSNAKIMYNIAKVCATVAPQAQLAIISNPVNSLVPLTCEVYYRTLTQQQQQQQQQSTSAPNSPATTTANQQVSSPQDQHHQQQTNNATQQQQQQQQQCNYNDNNNNNNCTNADNRKSEGKQTQQQQQQQIANTTPFHDSFRRIFGVTTLDVVRASTLTARSALLKPMANGMFRDPSRIQVPVVGGHAGKTIIPLLSQASPKLFDRRHLISSGSGSGSSSGSSNDHHQETRSIVQFLIESIQQAGIEVLNAKKGAGSATLAMAYAACRFTVSLLRAAQGEQNIIECAYVRQREPLSGLPADLDYFSTPLLLGKDGYVKSLGLTQQSATQALKSCSSLTSSTVSSQDGSITSASANTAGASSGNTMTTSQKSQTPPAAAVAAAPAINTEQSSSSSPASSGLLPFEIQMIEDGARELRTSVAKGEDFAKERLSAEK